MLKEKRITRLRSIAYNLKKEVVAERKNHPLLEMVKFSVVASRFSTSLWTEAVKVTTGHSLDVKALKKFRNNGKFELKKEYSIFRTI